MTEKLYYEDSQLAEHDARVVACEEARGGYAVRLDRSAFFPEGGGQPADHGTLGNANVLDCQEEDGDTVHLCDRALAIGSVVHAEIDWARRFDFMQQHTGEHLLSFAFYKLHGAHNVGFHLAETYATIDFDTPLDHAALAAAEQLANKYVWRNLPVTATLYASEEAVAALPLRKHAAGLVPPIRIVQIQDADCCTCCAPHCKTTGEVGSVRILDAAAYKGGTRITFYCGRRALHHACAEHAALDNIARGFSVSRGQAEAAVQKLEQDYAACRRRERLLAAALNDYEAAAFRAEAADGGRYPLVVRIVENADGERLRALAKATAGDDGFAALFARSDDNKLAYALCKAESVPLDIAEAAAAVNAALGGKGGGRGLLAQGTAPAAAHTSDSVAQLAAYFTQRFRAL